MCLRFSDADRASPSASLGGTSYHRMSSEWRDEASVSGLARHNWRLC
jgi:hypothetical protein